LIPAIVFVGSLTAPTAATAVTFGGQVYGAFNTHSMEDWNDAIDESNDLGAEWDNVGSSFTGGLEARMWVNPNWLIAAGWEPLFLSTEDGSSDAELSLNGHAFTATGGYFFPAAGNARYGVAAGLGLYVNSGELTSTGTSIDIQGNGVGFHFMGLGEWTVSPGFAVTGGVGYRIAKLSKTELTDGTNTVDSPYDNDYSGFMGSVRSCCASLCARRPSRQTRSLF
jgi:hypothetical protein